jgi:hypothetical protein
MWFRQAEACFRRSNITQSSTMYDHVLMKQLEAVVISVRNLINEIQPGANDSYERLKERLTDSYAKTRWQQAFALIKHPDLGDRRPSALRMRCWLSCLQGRAATTPSSWRCSCCGCPLQ